MKQKAVTTTEAGNLSSPDDIILSRLPLDLVRRLDDWIATRPVRLTRPEAAIAILEMLLTPDRQDQQRTDTKNAKAIELAGQAIDHHHDPTVSADEQTTRKRRLLKGPAEFRDARIDTKRKT